MATRRLPPESNAVTADEGYWPGITKGRSHAIDSTRRSSNRCGCSAVAGESLHSNAGNHQINPECHRSHSCRSVDTECYWTLSFLLRYPHWTVKDGGGTTPRRVPSPHNVAQLPRTPALCSLVTPFPADLIPGEKLPPAPEGAWSVVPRVRRSGCPPVVPTLSFERQRCSAKIITMPKTKSNYETALHAIEKALALMRSVQSLEGTDKDGVEHLLEMAVENLRK